MTNLSAFNSQGFFGQRPQMPEFGIKLRKLASGVLAAAALLMGSAIVVTSWLPAPVQQASVSDAELYLQDPAATPVAHKDLGDSISASTVLGSTLR